MGVGTLLRGRPTWDSHLSLTEGTCGARPSSPKAGCRGRAAVTGTSVVITTYNEARHIEELLGSLVDQGALEVILVDAGSTDGTVELAQDFQDSLPLTIIQKPCSRGAGRNMGVAAANGGLVAFTDGDGTVAPGWITAFEQAWDGDELAVLAGRTRTTGPKRFTGLHRVELEHRGQDVTWPSCNLAYPKALFMQLGGFDEAFVTAEDIDLNYRAIAAGAHIHHVPDAVVHAEARSSMRGFLKQAFWNGYGRKQLTRKHGRLWRSYSLGDMIRTQLRSPWAALRLVGGLAGYIAAKTRRTP